MSSRDTLLLSILTLVTALGWLVFDVYHASIDTTIPEEVRKQLSPVAPTFETGVIDRLKTRETYEIAVPFESEIATESGER